MEKVKLNMLHKNLFIIAHQCGDPSFYPTYKKLTKEQWRSYDELKHEQEKQLRYLIDYAYSNVPYYHSLLRNLGLVPNDIRTIKDLEKLPILTKTVIKEHWDDFKPAKRSSKR